MRRHVHVVLVAKQGIREWRLNNQAASDRKRVQDQQIKLKRDMFNDVQIEIHSSFELLRTQISPRSMRVTGKPKDSAKLQSSGFESTPEISSHPNSRRANSKPASPHPRSQTGPGRRKHL